MPSSDWLSASSPPRVRLAAAPLYPYELHPDQPYAIEVREIDRKVVYAKLPPLCYDSGMQGAIPLPRRSATNGVSSTPTRR